MADYEFKIATNVFDFLSFIKMSNFQKSQYFNLMETVILKLNCKSFLH